MYTIIMNEDKSLTATVKTKIYQREKLVDKIRFLFPQYYEDIPLAECVVRMKYLDQANVAHVEELELSDKLYITPHKKTPIKKYHKPLSYPPVPDKEPNKPDHYQNKKHEDKKGKNRNRHNHWNGGDDDDEQETTPLASEPEEYVEDDEVYEENTNRRPRHGTPRAPRRHPDGMLQYFLPVNTNLTKFSGDITVRITFSRINTDDAELNVLHTGEYTFEISPLSDYYAFVNDESLETIDQRLNQVDAMIGATEILADSINENKAEDLTVENNRLYLSDSNGEKLGEGADVGIPAINDGKYDEDYEGVLELDKIDPDASGDDPDDGTCSCGCHPFVEL